MSRSRPGSSPTLQDLAHELGLSKSAVSNALSGAKGVSERTRARVVAHARARGWRPHAGARALSTGRAGAIGICLARDPELLGTEAYFGQLIAGIEDVLAQTEYSLLLRMVPATDGEDLAVYEHWVRERRVDGVVLCDLTSDDPRVGLVERLGLPAVIQGEYHQVGLPVICSDIPAEAQVLVDHLAAAGHTGLVQVSGPRRLTHEARRIEAVAGRAQELGLRASVLETGYSLEEGIAAAEVLLDARGGTGVICSNDRLAAGLSRRLVDAGDAVAARFGVVSWDDSPLCELSRPSVTALSRSPIQLGRRSARELLALLGEQLPPPSTGAEQGSPLVVRETSNMSVR